MKKDPVRVYTHRFVFPPEAEDENQHVNNIEYVRLLQESAIAHNPAKRVDTEELHSCDWTWVVRSHFIEYLQPCRAGEPITVQTWVGQLSENPVVAQNTVLCAKAMAPCWPPRKPVGIPESAHRASRGHSAGGLRAYHVVPAAEEPGGANQPAAPAPDAIMRRLAGFPPAEFCH